LCNNAKHEHKCKSPVFALKVKLVLRKGSAAVEQQDKEDKEQDAKIASRRNDKARAKHVPASPLAGRLRGYARS
jgi:hypothetical protein